MLHHAVCLEGVVCVATLVLGLAQTALSPFLGHSAGLLVAAVILRETLLRC